MQAPPYVVVLRVNMATAISQLDQLPLSVRARAEQERRRRQRQHVPELQRCADNFIHFCMTHCKIYDATAKQWIPFSLWIEQQNVGELLTLQRLVVILKARQLGMTWLVLAYALWLMLFHPAATVLLFSLRDTEAVYLLGAERIKGMFKKLPPWFMMRKVMEGHSILGNVKYEWVPLSVVTDGSHHWVLANDSNARAFPTSAGDSYTATLAVVDEADLVPDLQKLLLRVKPTIDGGGQLILLSKANKELPQSEFKKIYRAAKAGQNTYAPVFLPWHVRPERTPEWYARQVKDAGEDGQDAIWENYPATDDEALAPKQLNKRIPYKLIKKVYDVQQPLDSPARVASGERSLSGAPMINGLRIFITPQRGRSYVAGADPAEGNPTSDDSALQILDASSGVQVAVLQGKFDVAVFAGHIETLCKYYKNAPVLVERNNHGHAVIALLQEHKKARVIRSDDKKAGWLDNARGKSLLYDHVSDTVRTEDCVIHDETTMQQLSSIEGATLRAPEGEADDLADAFALADKARMMQPPVAFMPVVGAPRAGLDTYRPR